MARCWHLRRSHHSQHPPILHPRGRRLGCTARLVQPGSRHPLLLCDGNPRLPRDACVALHAVQQDGPRVYLRLSQQCRRLGMSRFADWAGYSGYGNENYVGATMVWHKASELCVISAESVTSTAFGSSDIEQRVRRYSFTGCGLSEWRTSARLDFPFQLILGSRKDRNTFRPIAKGC